MKIKLEEVTKVFEEIKKTGKRAGEFTDQELCDFEWRIQEDFVTFLQGSNKVDKIYRDGEEDSNFWDYDEEIEWILTPESHRLYDDLKEKLIDEWIKLTGYDPDETGFDGNMIVD